MSLHRKERARPPEPTKRTNAELLVDGMGELLDELPDAGDEERDWRRHGAGVRRRPCRCRRSTSGAPSATPRSGRAATRPTAVAATALTDEGAPDPAGDRP